MTLNHSHWTSIFNQYLVFRSTHMNSMSYRQFVENLRITHSIRPAIPVSPDSAGEALDQTSILSFETFDDDTFKTVRPSSKSPEMFHSP
jgi:hypothetical protein